MLFILSKTLGVFLVPPGLFVLLLFLSLLLFLIKKRKIGLILLSLSLFFIYLVSIEPGKDLILSLLENAYPHPDLSKVQCRYIVVLGGGEIPHSPAENGKASVRPAVAKRLYEAFKLYRERELPILVSGGKVYGQNAESEAEAMARFLETVGVPAEKITEERKSRNTLENGIYSYQILARKGIKEICLVTSAYHMPRSVMIFREVGFRVTPVPADYRVYREKYGWYSYLPRVDYLQDSMNGFREYVGILYFELLQKRKVLKWRAREDSNLRPTD